MADENCKAIEKCIKDLLFNHPSPSDNVNSSQSSEGAVGSQIPPKKGYQNITTSPSKRYKTNASFQNVPPLLQQDIRVTTHHMSGNAEQRSHQNRFSPPKFPQKPSFKKPYSRGSQQNNFPVNGQELSAGEHPNISNIGIDANVNKEESLFNVNLQSSKISQEEAAKYDRGQDPRFRKKRRKDKKRKNQGDGDKSLLESLDLLSVMSAKNKSLELENIVSSFSKGDSPSANDSTQDSSAPPSQKNTSNSSDRDKDNNEPICIHFKRTPVFPEDKETVLLRKEGQCHFFCYICDYNSSDSSAITRHIASSNHKTLVKARELRYILCNLPEPLPKQVETITESILQVVNEHGLSEDDLLLRKVVYERVKGAIEFEIQGCCLEAIGSACTGFGLKDCHFDMVLKVAKEKNAADILFSTYELLKKDDKFQDVRNEFRKKIPQIAFVDVESGLPGNICIDNGSCYEFTVLLCSFVKMDPRLRTLGIAFRYWAKMCDIDKQDQGTLPPFCYILMLIHFLQQQQPPVLPVDTKDVDWHSENTCSIGELWIKMFRYYSLEYQCGEDVVCVRQLNKMTCDDKNWGTKILAIEDPIVHRNLAHVIPNRQVYQFIHECFIRTYNYFGHPQFSCGPAELTNTPKINSLKPVTQPKEIKNCDVILDSTEVEVKPDCSEKAPNAEDAVSISELMDDHDPDLPFEDVISIVNNLTIDEILSEEEEFEKDSADSLAEWGKNTLESARTLDMSPSLFANFPSLTIIAPDPAPPTSEISDDLEQKEKEKKVFSDIPETSLESYSWNLNKEKAVEKMQYSFLSQHFKGDKSVPLVCNLCQKQGHKKKECPDEILPQIAKLPPMTQDYIAILDSVCEQIVVENRPSKREVVMRDTDLQELEEYVQEQFPNARLQMFGSFCNGFGFTQSDMDICLTFKDSNNGKDLDCLSTIQKLALWLNENPNLSHVVAITSAKVPIVKFVFNESGLEGDISLYNTLAQHNTRMLELYCKIDERVRVLGYTLKYFAKILNIGDASRGSLSSYAYILMVLFFLQQRKPPVIPVLQELHNGKQPINMVDEWNAWFFNDIENLTKYWPEYGKNKESVGELWLGLLQFYTKDFDNNEYVVCIRQKELLTRFRKLWNSKSIAIEDPFDLSHNLGSGLSRRMNNYILKAFIRGRNHFGMSVLKVPQMKSAKNFLFDRYLLCEGQDPPNDRGCRYCGKIGHIVKDCPKKNQRKQDQRGTNGNKDQNHIQNQSPNKNDSGDVPRMGFTDRRDYHQRRDYADKRNRYPPRNNNSQRSRAPGSFERGMEVPPAKVGHLMSLQRFPNPSLLANPLNPPPFANKHPPSFVHRPATSTPFPTMNSGLVNAPSPHQNSLTRHSQLQIHPGNNSLGNNGRPFPSQTNAFSYSEHSFSRGGAHSNSGQTLGQPLSGKRHQYPGHNMQGPQHNPGRW